MANSKNLQLYLVALIPPEPIYSQVWQMKEEVMANFGSKAALKSPPHITLHMPFRWRADRQEGLIDCLKSAVLGQKHFEIRHEDYGCFEPRVIYVQVGTTPMLENLQMTVVRKMRRELKLLNADYKNRGFHPHMTIAFRDLKKPMFQQAWSAYAHRTYKAAWSCVSVYLLKHNGARWEVLEEFPFE